MLEDKPPLAELAHYGVKGMKWGKRKSSSSGTVATRGGIGGRINAYRTTPDSSGVSRRDARQAMKTQNVQTRREREDFERSGNRSQQIRGARANRLTAERRYEDIRREVKNQKKSGAIGKNAARVVLHKAASERYTNIYKAESITAGEKLVGDVLGLLTRAR